jgi:hypothetical protein
MPRMASLFSDALYVRCYGPGRVRVLTWREGPVSGTTRMEETTISTYAGECLLKLTGPDDRLRVWRVEGILRVAPWETWAGGGRRGGKRQVRLSSRFVFDLPHLSISLRDS